MAYDVTLMPGDGIGPEVVEAGCRVLEAAARADGGFACEFQGFDWGSAMYRASGRMMRVPQSMRRR